MASIKQVIEGLQVLGKYDDSIQADHDVIYAGPALVDNKVSKEDEKILKANGWFKDESADCWARFV